MLKNIRIIAVMVITALMFSFTQQTSYAREVSDSSYEILIIDEANLLTDREEDALYGHMKELSEYGNVILHTVSLTTSDYIKYNENYYYNNYGNESGLIFQIDMGNRQLVVSTAGDLDQITGREVNSIVDNIYKYASSGDYYSCAKACFSQALTLVNDGRIAHKMKYIDNAFLALLIGLILNFILVFAITSGRNSRKKLLRQMLTKSPITDVDLVRDRETKRKAPKSSGGSGFSGGGGGGFSGGGGGGGFSGHSGSHGF